MAYQAALAILLKMLSRIDVLLGETRAAFTAGSLSVTLWRPAAGIFVSRIKGHFTLEAATVVAAAVRDQVARDGRHCGFHDWSAMTDYDSPARVLLTDVARSILPVTERTHVLSDSPLVALGVRAASIIVGRLIFHPTAFSFERAMTASLQGIRDVRAPDHPARLT